RRCTSRHWRCAGKLVTGPALRFRSTASAWSFTNKTSFLKLPNDTTNPFRFVVTLATAAASFALFTTSLLSKENLGNWLMRTKCYKNRWLSGKKSVTSVGGSLDFPSWQWWSFSRERSLLQNATSKSPYLWLAT